MPVAPRRHTVCNRSLRLAVGIGAALLLLPGQALRAQSDAELQQDLRQGRDLPVTITADSLEYEAGREVYTARGNVVIVQGDRTLRADWIVFNPDTGAGIASGNVELVDGTDTLRASFVEFNIENLEGVMRNGSLDSPSSQFRTSGEEIEKTGENTWRFKRGVFTTCRCPDPDDTDPWRIRAEEADIEIDGYGTVKDANVDVLDVPVMWFPWMIFPIKTERQTGFLFPDLYLGDRKGFGIGLPFFWALRDDVNLTVTPEWTTRRGFKGDAELEYVAGERSWGEAGGALAYDQDIDPNSLDEPYDRERWSVGGRHHWYLPLGARFQTRYAFASDNDVPLDFDELSGSRADRYLESSAALSAGLGASERFGAIAAAHYADDLQNPDDIDRDRHLLQRLPELRLSALPGGIPFVPLLRPSLDADYVWFEQAGRPSGDPLRTGFADTGVDGVFTATEEARLGVVGDPHGDDASPGNPTGTEGDGLFQEGEPLTDRGHRVTLQPRLAAPFRLARLAEVYPEVGWHQTFYATRDQSSEARGLLTGRVDLRSRLRRRFGEDLVHRVEPFVGWAFVSGTAQSGNPLLTPATALPQERLRSLDLDALTRDPADRIERVHRLSFGTTHRILGAADAEADAERSLRADLTLLGLYDLEDDDFGDVVLDGRIEPWHLGSLRFHAGLDPDRVRIDEGLAEYAWSHPDGHAFRAGYRYLREIPDVFEDFRGGDRYDDVEPEDKVDEVSGGLTLAVTRQITASYRLAYSFETDLLLANQGVLEYLSRCGCWSVGVELSDDRARGLSVKVLYRVIGLGKEAAGNPGGLFDW